MEDAINLNMMARMFWSLYILTVTTIVIKVMKYTLIGTWLLYWGGLIIRGHEEHVSGT